MRPFPMRPERQPRCIRCGAEEPPAHVANSWPKAGEWGLPSSWYHGSSNKGCFFQVIHDYATHVRDTCSGLSSSLWDHWDLKTKFFQVCRTMGMMIMMIMMVHQPFVMTIQPWRQVKKRSPTMTQSRQRVSLSTAKTIASIPPKPQCQG